MTTRHPLTLACCVFLAGSSVSLAADLVALDGKTVKGDVLGVSGDSLTYKGADGQEAKLSVKALAEVRLGNKALPLGTAPYDEIELTDGSVLKVAHEGTLVKARAFTVAPVVTENGIAPPVVTLSADHMLYWVRKANVGTIRADWKLKIVEKRGKRDQLVLFNDTDGFGPIEGTLIGGSDDGTKLTFVDTANKRDELVMAKITGGMLFYNPPPAVLAPTAGRVFDVFGNVLLATEVSIDGKGQVTVKTVSGATAVYDSLAAIARMDFAQGNVKYLAEVEPAVDAPAAIPGEPYQPFLLNKSREGTGLRVGGKPYQKGVWVSPETTLTFPLGGNYREFKAMVGIDDAVPVVTSKVTLVIEVDGRKLVEETFDNATKAKKKVLELNLNVKDAKELKITVGRESLFSGEGLNFADARLQK